MSYTIFDEVPPVPAPVPGGTQQAQQSQSGQSYNIGAGPYYTLVPPPNTAQAVTTAAGADRARELAGFIRANLKFLPKHARLAGQELLDGKP